MMIGQSAGIAAALAAADRIAVQSLPYSKLRKRMLANGQVLDLPKVSEAPEVSSSFSAKSFTGIVLDDRDAQLKGSWVRSTNFKPYLEDGYVFRLLSLLDLFGLWGWVLVGLGAAKVGHRDSWATAATLVLLIPIGIAAVIAIFTG